MAKIYRIFITLLAFSLLVFFLFPVGRYLSADVLQTDSSASVSPEVSSQAPSSAPVLPAQEAPPVSAEAPLPVTAPPVSVAEPLSQMSDKTPSSLEPTPSSTQISASDKIDPTPDASQPPSTTPSPSPLSSSLPSPSPLSSSLPSPSPTVFQPLPPILSSLPSLIPGSSSAASLSPVSSGMASSSSPESIAFDEWKKIIETLKDGPGTNSEQMQKLLSATDQFSLLLDKKIAQVENMTELVRSRKDLIGPQSSCSDISYFTYDAEKKSCGFVQKKICSSADVAADENRYTTLERCENAAGISHTMSPTEQFQFERQKSDYLKKILLLQQKFGYFEAKWKELVALVKTANDYESLGTAADGVSLYRLERENSASGPNGDASKKNQ